MRRLVRPHFLHSRPLKWSYDVITIVLSRYLFEFGIISVDQLWMRQSILFWR